MSQVDFKELANYCVEEYKGSVNTGSGKYIGTMYVCIGSDNEVLCSATPHILSKAKKCILIHTKEELAISNWYLWYRVDYINEEGCVLGNNLGNGFKLDIQQRGSFSNQVMELSYDNTVIYECHPPFVDQMQKVWAIYRRAQICESKQSIELLAEIIEKDETILEQEEEIKNIKFSNYLLEKQNKQYKKLLSEIKELVEQNNKG